MPPRRLMDNWFAETQEILAYSMSGIHEKKIRSYQSVIEDSGKNRKDKESSGNSLNTFMDKTVGQESFDFFHPSTFTGSCTARSIVL